MCGAAPGDVAEEERPQPRVRLLTDSLRFRDVGRDRVEARGLRIANLGTANLEISRIDVPGAGGRVTITPDPAGFVLLVPPQGEYTLTVRFTGSDGVPFTAPLTLTTNDPSAPRVSVPLVVDYSGLPDLVVTESAPGQHIEDLDGRTLELGPVPEGRGVRRRLFVKNLGIGGMFAIFATPTLAGEGGFSLVMLSSADEDGRFRLGRFAAFCAVAADCTIGGAACVDRVCAVEEQLVDAVVLEIGVDLSAGVAGGAELRIPYGAASGSFADEVRVILQARGAPADLYLEPAAIDFGPVSVGFPQSRLVRIFNLAEVPLTLESAVVSGPAASPPPLAFATPLGFAVPHELVSFAAVLVRVDLVASADRLGPTSGSLVVTARERPEVGHTVTLTGRARIGPVLVTEPLAELDLGHTHVEQAAAGVVWLQNVAIPTADPLLLFDAMAVSLAGGAVEVGLPLPAPIPAGGASPLSVRCTPAGRGETSGRLTLVTDAPDNPIRSLVVRCHGVDPTLRVIYASRDETVVRDWWVGAEHPCRGEASYPSPCMDFGAIYAGRSVTLPVRLANIGADPLRLSGLALSSPGPFSLPPVSLPFILAPGQETDLELGYSAAATPGTETGLLLIEHDDADLAPISLSLLGSTTSCDAGLRDCSASVSCQAENTVAACCPSLTDPDACLACDPCPAKNHTVRSCLADSCVYECVAGWYDLDGDGHGSGGPFENGCEYPCVVSSGGVERCDNLDNDCDGIVDEGLAFSDEGGEAPASCTPGGVGFLGTVSESDLGEWSADAGVLNQVLVYNGRIYASTGSPTGDVDWLRVGFVEEDACSAVGFRLLARLEPPPGTALELCVSVFDPFGQPPASAACTPEPFSDCVTTASGQAVHLTVEWPESCGVADDRVIDLRLRADPSLPASYSCLPYQLELLGAALY